MNQNKVIITGGTGFIGSHVAEYFCREGINVFCGIRSSSEPSFLKTLPVHLIEFDIHNTESLKAAFQGAKCVIHAAGLVNDWSSFDDFYKTNVTGTLNVLKACYHNHINDVIITGSISSYGEEDSLVVKSEGSPYKPIYNYFLENVVPSRMNHYRVSKSLATQEAIKFAETRGMNLTILEPVWVYGEREFTSGFYEYMKVVKHGIPCMPGSKKNKFHVIYARDLARAYYLAYLKKPAGVNRIIIGNTNRDLMERIYTLFCNEMSVKKPANIPRYLIYPFALLLELMAALFQSKKPPLLTRARLNMLYDNIEYSTVKASRQLGFENEYSLEEGIKNTVRWYKHNKLI
ncbi:MAG: SDR family NAD(P)-dependent oxidoreductase [Bacteroidales bacterium]|nr:SDR family NAD(P)-dependent oxidoreductase [Bacteroidales bacterium]